MNNIDQAAEVIRRVDGNHTLGAGALAEALADAGLLMPELPEPQIMPYGARFDEGGTNYGADVLVCEKGDNVVHAYAAADYGMDLVSMPPEEARKMAARLLAAANYAERTTDE